MDKRNTTKSYAYGGSDGGALKYRPEIDGLRAIAVLSVLVFHASSELLRGGFLGVDIFFVISGYLITGIILGQLVQGTFSFAHFFERRVRRIVPALNVTMLLCIPFGFVLLQPDEMENFGQSLIATSAFGNNILLMATSGYFALENSLKPLMHTWSLGVEEHYYLLIPFFASLAFLAAKRRGVAIMTVIVGAASLFSCLWIASLYPDANFYLVFSRAWEFAAGGLTVIVEPRLRAFFSKHAFMPDWLAGVGIFAILVPILVFDMQMNLPNWPTIFPVLGSCMVLAFCRKGTVASKLLGSSPLVLVGVVSYSAYLFHQPVFAFVRVINLTPPSQSFLIMLIFPILVLAWLSWRFIEHPFRNAQMISLKKLCLLLGTTTLAIGAAGGAMYWTSGFLQWRPELATGDPQFGRRQNAIYNQRPFQFLDKPFSGSVGPRVLVVGDSFARDFINMGLESGALKPAQISYSVDRNCSLGTNAIKNAAAADVIIIAESFAADGVACLESQFQQARRASRGKVLILGIKGFGWNNNAVMLLPPKDRYEYRVSPSPEIIAANVKAARQFAGNYINVMDKITDSNGRVAVFTPQRKFVSQDHKHLTKAGAAYIGAIVFRDPALRWVTASR